VSSEDKLREKKYKDLLAKAKKRRKEKLHLMDVDKEIPSDVYTSGEISFRLYCHIVGYGVQAQKLSLKTE
jgi:hypothetical protein